MIENPTATLVVLLASVITFDVFALVCLRRLKRDNVWEGWYALALIYLGGGAAAMTIAGLAVTVAFFFKP